MSVATVSYTVLRQQQRPDGTWTDLRPLRAAQALVAGTTFDDHTVAAGVDYRYVVQANGDNGTTSSSSATGFVSGAVEGATFTPVGTTTATYDVAVYG